MMTDAIKDKIKIEMMFDELPEEIPGAVFQIEKVNDWEKRIASYSDYKKALYTRAFEKQKEFEDVMADTGKDWKVTINNKK